MKITRGLHLIFSMKRQIGYTALMLAIGHITGIPTTRRGRQAKLGRWLGMK